MKVIATEYMRQEDGSGVITETFEDGSQNVVVLPPALIFDAGPSSMSRAHRELLQRGEDRITRLDREGR
jgi:hypothetical protein